IVAVQAADAELFDQRTVRAAPGRGDNPVVVIDAELPGGGFADLDVVVVVGALDEENVGGVVVGDVALGVVAEVPVEAVAAGRVGGVDVQFVAGEVEFGRGRAGGIGEEGVVARAAEQPLTDETAGRIAGVAVDLIVAVVAVNLIDARAAVHQIVVAAAMDDVVAVVAG